MFVFPSQGLQSGGGHAPIPAPGCPNTGGLARVPEIAITTRHTLAPRSAETGRRSASGGRKAFPRPRARASAVSLVLRTSSFVSCGFPSRLFFPVCSTTLWVGQLDKRTQQQDVACLLEEFGQIESINVSPVLPNKAPRVSTRTHPVMSSSSGGN